MKKIVTSKSNYDMRHFFSISKRALISQGEILNVHDEMSFKTKLNIKTDSLGEFYFDVNIFFHLFIPRWCRNGVHLVKIWYWVTILLAK